MTAKQVFAGRMDTAHGFGVKSCPRFMLQAELSLEKLQKTDFKESTIR
jgi:hypothetical protein